MDCLFCLLERHRGWEGSSTAHQLLHHCHHCSCSCTLGKAGSCVRCVSVHVALATRRRWQTLHNQRRGRKAAQCTSLTQKHIAEMPLHVASLLKMERARERRCLLPICSTPQYTSWKGEHVPLESGTTQLVITPPIFCRCSIVKGRDQHSQGCCFSHKHYLLHWIVFELLKQSLVFI